MPIAYNISQLLKEGIGATRTHEIAADLYALDENNPDAVHVEGKVKLVRTLRGILATGNVRLRMVQVCRRCLEPTQADLGFDFEEEFIPSIDIETGARLPITDEDEPELVIDERHILDLTEVVRQYAVATATSLGLCRPDCRGLCPTCGQNLNFGICGCNTTRVDPRLAMLGQLLDDEESESQ